MHCPACERRISLRELSRIYNPFRIRCRGCARLLSASSSFGRMLLVSLGLGAAWGVAAVATGAGWAAIAASLVLGLAPLMALLTPRLLRLQLRPPDPRRGWHHGPGPRSTSGYAALAVNLSLYLWVMGDAAWRLAAGTHVPPETGLRPLLSVLGELYYVYLPGLAGAAGAVAILSRRVAGRTVALLASGALVVLILAPDLTIWRVLRDFGHDGSSSMTRWPYVVSVSSLAVLGIALLCTPGARRYYGRNPAAGQDGVAHQEAIP